MKKIFLLLAFTGIVSAASASSVIALTKGTVITLCDDKKKDDKKKCDKKKACCKTQSAQGSSGCHATKEVVKNCPEAKEGKKACCKAKAEGKTASVKAVSVPTSEAK